MYQGWTYIRYIPRSILISNIWQRIYLWSLVLFSRKIQELSFLFTQTILIKKRKYMKRRVKINFSRFSNTSRPTRTRYTTKQPWFPRVACRYYFPRHSPSWILKLQNNRDAGMNRPRSTNHGTWWPGHFRTEHVNSHNRKVVSSRGEVLLWEESCLFSGRRGERRKRNINFQREKERQT